MKPLIFYVNGQFVPENEARISVLDLGFVRGYGVFDFLRTYNDKPFKLNEHLKRLENSARGINLSLPVTLEELSELVKTTLAKNHLPEAGIKIMVTGGEGGDGITPVGKSTLVIIVKPLVSYPKDYYINGVKVITVDLVRELPEIKSTNYISAIMAKNLAKRKDAIEALYKNGKSEVLEGTQTNFFVFKKNILVTPKKGILSGITREVVLRLAAKDCPIKLRPISYGELKTIDEAFITSTTKEVMPVVRIDNLVVGNGKVGYNTKRIMDSFKKYIT